MSYRPRMPSNDALIETGRLPSGHPYARIGSGSRVVLSIPGLSFTAEVAKPASIRRSWKRWLEPIERHDLTFVDVGRRADLPPGSTSVDIADDYAAVIREQWGSAVGVMGISTGGGYAQWLANRHPELVDRLVLAYTGHRVPPEVAAVQRRAVDHFLAGRWRSGFARWHPGSCRSMRASPARSPGCWVRTSPAGHRTCASSGSTRTPTTRTTRPTPWAGSAARRSWSRVARPGLSARPHSRARRGPPRCAPRRVPRCRSRPRRPIPGGCLRVPRGDRRRASSRGAVTVEASSAQAVAGALGGESVVSDGDERDDRLVPGRPGRVQDRDPALGGVHGVGEDSVQGRVVRLGVDAGDAFERRLVHAEVQSEDAGPLEVEPLSCSSFVTIVA